MSGKAIDEGEGSGNYIGNTYAGIVHFHAARSESTATDGSVNNITVTCFEYIGDKLDTKLTNISDEIKDIVGVTMEGVVASVGTTTAASAAGISVDSTSKTSPKIGITTGSVTSGETKLVTGGAVHAVTDALASRISQLEGIQHFSVVIVPEGQKITDVSPLVENTIYLVKEEGVAEGTYIEYIAFKQGETVVTEKIGSTAIDLSGYTTDAEHEALADRVTALDAATTGRVAVVEGKVSTLETTTIPAAIETAKGYTDTKIATELAETGSIGSAIKAAKEQAIASAEVTITAGTGIVVTGEGKGTTFEIAVSDDVATAATVSALSQVVASNKTELEGKITAAETAASTALETAKTEIKGTTDALDARLQTAEGKVSTLEGQVSALTTGENSVDSKVNAAKTELQGKIDAINTSLTTGDIHNEIDGVRQTANAAKATADTAVQTVTGDTYVTATKTGTGVTLATQISAIDSKLAEETSVVGAAIKAAKTAGEGAGATALAAAQAAQSTADAAKATADTAVQTSSGDTYVSATKSGTAITVSTNISAIDTELAKTSSTVGAAIKAASDAAAQALTDAKAYSDSLHTTSLDYVVLGDSESLPTASAATLGKIYLVASQNAPTADGAAISGAYVEYMTRKVGEGDTATYTWEKIGTTAADLSAYAKTSEVEASVKAVQDEVDALETVVKSGVGNIDANWEAKLNGLSLSTIGGDNSGTLKNLSFGLIGGNSSGLSNATLPANVISVEQNVASRSIGDKVAIATDMIVSGFSAAPSSDTLTTWVADLSNLTVGDNMFNGCTKLTVFIGDLSSLTSATGMFNGCNLDAESLEILAENLPTAASGATIDIGATTNATDEVIATIEGKGWTVTSNGTAL